MCGNYGIAFLDKNMKGFSETEPLLVFLTKMILCTPDSRKRDDEFSPRLAEPSGFYWQNHHFVLD